MGEVRFLARVSSADQSLARQLKVARERFDIPNDDEHIFCDKISGSTFDRPRYNALKEIVQAGDEVVVKEFDRFGRDKAAMKAELEWFRQKGVVVRILDIPTTLIDVQDQTWVLDMVNNILIEVLGAVAEQERKKTKQRQKEGIAAMPVVDGKKKSGRTGKFYGRPVLDVDAERFQNLAQKQKDGKVTVAAACAELGVSRTKWYKLAKGV